VNLIAQFPGGRTLAQVEATSVARAVPRLVGLPLTLINSWANHFSNPKRTPANAVDAQGVVHLRGGIHNLTVAPTREFAVLPAALRPSSAVSVTADTYAGNTGRLYIGSDGTVWALDAVSQPVEAPSFTSLDGITYALG